MTDDSHVNVDVSSDVRSGSVDVGTEEPQPAVEAPAMPPPSQQHVWSMPTSEVTRKRANDVGRIAVKTSAGIASFVAGMARTGARMATRLWRAIESVPPTVQLFSVAGVLALLGMVGAISLHDSVGLACIVVVVPVCSIILGALGHRWYSGLDSQAKTPTDDAEPTASDLRRSVEYVDAKLAVALTSFGTERHQQAVIALFQAKTAVELTLGTEQDSTGLVDLSVPAAEPGSRPRIRVGSTSTSQLGERSSLAAS